MKFRNINKKLITYIVGVHFFWEVVIKQQQKTD